MTSSKQHICSPTVSCVCQTLEADACLSGVDVHVCPFFGKVKLDTSKVIFRKEYMDIQYEGLSGRETSHLYLFPVMF